MNAEAFEELLPILLEDWETYKIQHDYQSSCPDEDAIAAADEAWDAAEARSKKLGADLYNPFDESKKKLKEIFGTDEKIQEATQWCMEQVKKYTINPGNSWGKAPNNIVVGWGEKSCDDALNLHRLNKEEDDDVIPSE